MPDAALWGLPDPEREADFYADIPTKRFFAWIIDTVLTTVITIIIVPFTAFTAVFFLPFLFLVVNFLYRWATLSNRSATWGMRLVSIEFRSRDGQTFDGSLALLHTLGSTIQWSMILPQLASIFTIVTTSRSQSLTDMVLGTAAINHRARS
ncbi:RDD family protein [Cochlodiniinecator piscidefendens]|uniref:RDD family protein n=1 Tax=Cochlodiniinecator piscidefendens TaxID=2715756 RepID=UPI0014083743|nr:RDD family protein [Cochlodiniinecator piscidefendens]